MLYLMFVFSIITRSIIFIIIIIIISICLVLIIIKEIIEWGPFW